MNRVEQILAWWNAPASHGQAGGGWLDWFGLLSRGWSKGGVSPAESRPPSSAPTMVDVTNGQALVGLLDQLIRK